MLSVEPGLDVFFLWVYVVKDSVCVNLMRGCENYHLKVLVGLLKALHDIGSDIDTSVNCFFVWKVYFKNDIGVLSLYIINAMDQSFIHVKDNQLFLLVRELRWREVNAKILHLLWLNYSYVLFNELQSLHGLNKVLLV